MENKAIEKLGGNRNLRFLALADSAMMCNSKMEAYAEDVTVSDSYLQEEYRLLGQQTTPRPRTEAEYNHAHASATLPCNKTKNRYTDVLPVEATRIKLAARDDEPGSDYINANIVTDPTPISTDGSAGNDIYICAQAPLQNTLNDFWRMVWEQVRPSPRDHVFYLRLHEDFVCVCVFLSKHENFEFRASCPLTNPFNPRNTRTFV